MRQESVVTVWGKESKITVVETNGAVRTSNKPMEVRCRNAIYVSELNLLKSCMSGNNVEVY